jgi:hypothetical protein
MIGSMWQAIVGMQGRGWTRGAVLMGSSWVVGF